MKSRNRRDNKRSGTLPSVITRRRSTSDPACFFLRTQVIWALRACNAPIQCNYYIHFVEFCQNFKTPKKKDRNNYVQKKQFSTTPMKIGTYCIEIFLLHM